MAAKFEISKDHAGKYRFHLKAPNGEIIAASQGYETKANAENGIQEIKKHAPGAITAVGLPGAIAKFEIDKDHAGKFRFHLKHPNGEIIAASQGYETKTNAENAIEAIKKHAPGAITAVDNSTPIALVIYRDLRVGGAVILVMVFAAVIIERVPATCWQSAISAYYYTSAHSIVIAALLALGTLFIVYKGSSDTEDVLLTLAGVCTFIAAMVPQLPRPASCWPEADLPKEYKVEPAWLFNVWAVVIALSLGWVAMWLVQWRRGDTRHPRTAMGMLLSRFVFWPIMAVGLITLMFFPDKFKAWGHGAAGVLMLAAFIATAFCTAYIVGREDVKIAPHRRFFQVLYWAIALLMLGTLIFVVFLHQVHPHWAETVWGLVIEAVLIIEFALYWVVQTVELWNTADRTELLPEATRNQTEHVLTLRQALSVLAEAWKDRATKGRGKFWPFL